MSKIKFIFERKNLSPLNPFYNIGPPPFVSVSSENVYVNDVMHTVDRVTLSGRIKKDNCSDDFSQLYQKAKNLIDNFNRSFDKLSISEPTQPGDADDIPYAPIYEWEYVIVRSVSFDENKWFDWVPYTIELDCYKNGYFASDGIINPSRTVSYDTQNDNIVSLTITCSCNGINNSNQAIENARAFADLNSDVLLADITQSVSIHPNIKNVNYFNPSFPEKKILKSVNETIDRLAGTVSVQKTYLLQEEVGVSNGILRFTRSLNTSENGEATVSINGSIEGCIDRKNELGQGYSSDTTLDMIEDDIKNKDWYSIAIDGFSEKAAYSDPDIAIRNLLTGKQSNRSTKYLWSTYDASTTTFIKNPNSWVSSLDLSGFIVACSENGYKERKLGVLVSPRHYLFAWHFKPPIGTDVYFLDPDGNVITKTISNYVEVGIDVGIGLLDSDLPSNIKYYPILPPDYRKYINLEERHLIVKDQVTYSSFTGSISGTTLTVTSVYQGSFIEPNQVLTTSGPNPIIGGTYIVSQLTGADGKEGTYQVSVSQTVGSEIIIGSITSGVAIPKCTVRKIIKSHATPVEAKVATAWSTKSPFTDFFEDSSNNDSGSSLFTIINNEIIILGHLLGATTAVPYQAAGDGPSYSYFSSEINAAMLALGGGYSLSYIYSKGLYLYPTNFSIQRNPDQNSVNFSLEYSNKINNDITIVDTTTITNNYETSTKCIEVSLAISSSLKNHEARWDSVVNYFNSFDMIEYVKRKWEEYGNEEELNLNVNNTSYSEDKFQGTIQVTASFCASKGEGCGCLQNMQYSYQFVPPLKEYKVGVAFGGKGCHFVEDIDCLKRASFTLAGRLIQSTCCSYEKTIMELKNKVNQISNYVFFGEDKILDSSEISSKKPNGEISFSFTWSAKKAEIIPENIQ